MQKQFADHRKYAQWFQSTPSDMPVPDIQPGDEVVIKIFSQESKLEPKWKGSYCVLALLSKFQEKTGYTTHMSNEWWVADQLTNN